MTSGRPEPDEAAAVSVAVQDGGFAGAAAADVVFLDTSVLVYAHDASAPRKRDVARGLLLEHLGAGTLRTSTQALAEYFSVVTGKGEAPLGPAAASWLIDQLPAEAVVAPGLTTLRAAARLSAEAGISVWDALIVEAARECRACVLYTEDARLVRAVNGARAAADGAQATADAGPAAAPRGSSAVALTAVDPFADTAGRPAAV